VPASVANNACASTPKCDVSGTEAALTGGCKCIGGAGGNICSHNGQSCADDATRDACAADGGTCVDAPTCAAGEYCPSDFCRALCSARTQRISQLRPGCSCLRIALRCFRQVTRWRRDKHQPRAKARRSATQRGPRKLAAGAGACPARQNNALAEPRSTMTAPPPTQKRLVSAAAAPATTLSSARTSTASPVFYIVVTLGLPQLHPCAARR